MKMFLFMFWLLTHGGKMYVTPQVCFAPCNVEVRISPPEEGDALRIEADSGEYYTADLRPKPSTTRVYTLKNLPEGNYTIKATVYDHQKAIWAEEKPLQVAGSADLLHDQSKNDQSGPWLPVGTDQNINMYTVYILEPLRKS